MDDLIRSRMHEALDVALPDPGLRVRVMSSLPVRERPARRFRLSSFQWTSGLVAALLALAVIAGLIFSRSGLGLHGPAPSGPLGRGTVVTPVTFTCSLPVIVDVYPPAFMQIKLPSGLMVNESIEPDKFNFQASYDVQAGTWVPVPSSAVSPDGRSYAYALPGDMLGGSNGSVHVVDVITGKDRQVWAGSGGAQLVGYLSSGIYFLELGSRPPAFLWVVDPAKPSAAHRIGPIPTSWDLGVGPDVIGPLGMFSVVRTPPATYPDRVEHMDFATGAVTTWFVNPTGPTPMRLLGLDGQGYPVVVMNRDRPAFDSSGQIVYRGAPDNPTRVLLVTGQDQSLVIADGSNAAFEPESAFGDAHGVWFGEAGSIWLYDRASGLKKVFAIPMTQFPTPSPLPGKFIPPPRPGDPTPPPEPPDRPSGATLSVFGPCT